ncbi:3-hydroxyisobutyrate dehydrogenase [Microvirga sp. W0021]|uniref:3-hydroxyisobutyrate dehydrogenase n=1 Tax=Hohaiivirga grylli TaxID=3133970 RepID=A0ABV0BJS8_9HYPH
MTNIAFIGLGNMGGPMAANLVKAGLQVKGFDLVPALQEEAAKNGITIASSAVEAVKDADVVITMLPAGKHVLSVWESIIEATRPSVLLIDCSTIDITSARQAHALAQKLGRLSLDAPVSGGTVGAQAATLTFMVGGNKEAFATGEPVLQKMGKRIVHCGDAGAGQAAKICNNMILGISMIGVAEAFVLAEKLGLSHQALFDVASTSSGSCWALNVNCPVEGPVPTSPANRAFAPGFMTDLMLKDMRLSQEAAAASGSTTPLGAEATQLYSLHSTSGHGSADFSSIINMLRGK